jgi:hypothetical protein
MDATWNITGRRRFLHLGALALGFGLLAAAPAPGAAGDGVRPGRQLAQAASPFVAKWVWASEWGPVTLNITEVLPDGRARGELAVTVSKGIRRFKLADKASGVEMVGTVADGLFVGRLKSGTTMRLRLVDGKLVGPYARGDGQKANAVFVK